MKYRFLGIVSLMTFCGCSDPVASPSEVAVAMSNHLMNRLSSNASVRVIIETKNVRSNLTYVVDDRRRRDMINEWKTSLYNIPVKGLRPSDRYAAVREAYRVVTWDVVGAMWDIAESYEDAWSVYFESLEWLDAQCEKMRPGIPRDDSDIHQEMDKWKHYQALVEYRECAIENLELNGFDDKVYNVGTERMDAIRVKFERMIGRSVRPRSAINRLGQYQKKVRARIEQEMKDTLGLKKKKVLDR